VSKKIILRFKGGLGNQLFIYSFYLFLKSNLSIKIFVDATSGYDQYLFANKFNQSFHINKLDKKLLYSNKKDSFSGLFGKLKRFLIKNFNFFQKYFKVHYISSENINLILSEINKSKFKVIYIDGYFQNLKIANFSKGKLLSKINKIKKKKIDKKDTILCITNYDWQKKDEKIKNRLRNILKNTKGKINLVSFNPLNLIKWIGSENLNICSSNYIKDPVKKLATLSQYKKFIINESTFHFWIIFFSKFHSFKIVNNSSKIFKSFKHP